MRARFALDEGRPDQARRELQGLAERAPGNRRVQALYADVLERERDWEALCALLPRLRRALGEQQAARRERRAWLARLQHLGQKPGFNDAESRARELRELWKAVPTSLKHDPAMVARYAGFLAQLGEGRRALQLVREQLDRDWDDRLPPVLEAIDDLSPDDLLQTLEKWLVERPGNAAVLVTAGRVALKARLWGRRRTSSRPPPIPARAPPPWRSCHGCTWPWATAPRRPGCWSGGWRSWTRRCRLCRCRRMPLSILEASA